METEKDRIIKVMEKEGLNATQFAAEIGIKAPTLSHILNGRNNPSLDVLKRILDRYRTISSDWLILGIGAMYREIRPPKTLSLFDSDNENGQISDTYNPKVPEKVMAENLPNEIMSGKNTNESQHLVQGVSTIPHKSVKKIIVYYDDNTFQEFHSESR